MFSKHKLIILFLFSSTLSFSQKKFDLKISEENRSIMGNKTSGFTSYFDFTRDEVRKEWWRFAKQFGNPLDMRDYYQVKIPANINDGNIDMLVFTQSTEEDSGTDFFIGIEKQDYLEQIKYLLIAFKKRLYLNHYLSEIALVELKIEELSIAYSDQRLPSTLEEIIKHQNQIEKMKTEIIIIEQQ